MQPNVKGKSDRGPKSPILLQFSMIDKESVKNIVEKEIEGTDIFVVNVQISVSNDITVLLDSWTSVSIDNCVKISRAIEGTLDREAEDFALEVSSAGLDHPFMVMDQYKKNLGKDVEVIFADGGKESGKLLSVSETGMVLETEKKVKIEGKKKKQLLVEQTEHAFDSIKSTKIEISFK